MSLSITPFSGDSAMKPWPSLAEKAFCLRDASRPEEKLFFYDLSPVDSSQLAAAPVVVLIHGLGDEADSWRHLIPLINSRCRVLAPDLPGFGRSVAAGKISLKNHAAVVLKLIEAVTGPPGSNGPKVFLAGNSLGALVAEEVALTKPGLARGLILIDGSIPGGPPTPGPFALAKLLFSRKWYRAYRDNPQGAWVSLYPYYTNLDGMPLEDREFLRQRVMARVESSAQEQAFFQTQRSLVRAYLADSSKFARRIRRYGGKILLLWGDKDRIIPLSSAETFKTLRSDIELEIISGAGHLPQQEKPEETARLIANFMDLVVD